MLFDHFSYRVLCDARVWATLQGNTNTAGASLACLKRKTRELALFLTLNYFSKAPKLNKCKSF